MDSDAIGKEIDRVLYSRAFANKKQLRKLLQVLFKNYDLQHVLTADQVIQELWPTETKTKGSADVATEMNRLRHALKSYYEREGANDPITIILPNRASTVGSSAQDRQWIIAHLREEIDYRAEDRSPVLEGNPSKTLKLVGALAVVLGIVAYASVRILVTHQQPQFGRVDGTVLRIMDARGKELWSKDFPAGFSTDWYYQKGLESRVWFEDLEGKGHTSVLFLYLPAASSQAHSSTLICYSDRGKEEWRWTPGRELPELAGSPATFRTTALRVLKATGNRPPRIVVASIHDTWWPSQIAILDPNGKTISEYWHSGGLPYMVLADLQGDGKEEIVATGVANGYDHQATLVVLDPDRVFGASSEVRPEFQIHGMGLAQERLRLLFPRSDLNRALFQFNLAMDPSFTHSDLRLTVAECITPLPPGCRIWYEFDKDFHLIAAYAGGDEFRSAHERFYQTGKNAHRLSPEEQAAFLKVRCLVGCKSEFVPVGNLVP